MSAETRGWATAAIAVLAAAAVGGGLALSGGPGQGRKERRDEARQQARAHIGQVGGNRVGERECGLSAPEQFGMRFRNERPRHGFHHAARRQRAFDPGVGEFGMAECGAEFDVQRHVGLADRAVTRTRRGR